MEMSSSVNKVVSNDDLLIEILLRLPVISLILFKTVSKRWLGLIISPSFNLRLVRIPNLHPPSGLFLQKKISPEKSEFSYDFVPLDIRIPENKSPFTLVSHSSNVEVLHSCNGLFLCCIRGYPDKFYIYNPCINLFKKLPKVHPIIDTIGFLSEYLMLDFDPKNSPHYKILHIVLTNSPHHDEDDIDDDHHHLNLTRSWQTQTYSSETGIWSVGNILPLKSFSGISCRAVYWNGAIHWLDEKNQVMHFRFDIGCLRLISSQPPVTLDGTDHKLFDSSGSLLYSCMVDTHRIKHLQIYEMRNECSGWVVKYLVRHEDMKATFLKTWEMSDKEFDFRVVCIVLGERDDDSFLVMGMCGKIVQYNLLSKTLHELCDFGPVDEPYYNFNVFPFVASFAGV